MIHRIASVVLAVSVAACLAGAENNVDLTVGVYYYPWHASNFHGRNYLREHLVPPQLPELGEYSDRDPEVISQHIAWSKQANIDLWVASWWGPNGTEDRTLRDVILPHDDLGDLKIALFYETTGRTRDFTDYSQLAPDISHIATHYFNHPNYLRLNGRPVLFVYLTRVLSARGTLESSVQTMRDAALAAGENLFVVGDQVFGKPPTSTDQIAFLDAVTNYDVYGSMAAHGYAGGEKVESYYADQARWKAKAVDAGVGFVPAVTPGFNDKGVRDGHEPVSRKLTAGSEFGSLFQAMLPKAIPLTDPNLEHLLLVTSWNEWHEDTQIEPVAESPPTSKDDSSTGDGYTRGLEYEGYGTKYLDILKQETDRVPASLWKVQ